MQIRVCSPLATFAYAMAAEFEARCGAVVSVSTSEAEEQTDASLRYRPGLSATEVLRLIEVLHPIKAHVFEDPMLTGCDAQITVSWDKSLG